MLEFYFSYCGVLKRRRSGAFGGEMDRIAGGEHALRAAARFGLRANRQGCARCRSKARPTWVLLSTFSPALRVKNTGCRDPYRGSTAILWPQKVSISPIRLEKVPPFLCQQGRVGPRISRMLMPHTWIRFWRRNRESSADTLPSSSGRRRSLHSGRKCQQNAFFEYPLLRFACPATAPGQDDLQPAFSIRLKAPSSDRRPDLGKQLLWSRPASNRSRSFFQWPSGDSPSSSAFTYKIPDNARSKAEWRS